MDIQDELDLENGVDLDQSDEEIDDHLENPDAEAVEETADGGTEDNPEDGQNDPTQKKPAKKRVVLNPRPKLDSQRLGGPKGIPILPKLFENKKFKGKGFEKEDLNEVMSTLEHWGHRLFPIMTFDTLLTTIEKLGTKKPTQVCIKKMRMDMPILDDDFVTQRDEDEAEPTAAANAENQDDFENMDMDDAFDNLVRNRDSTMISGTNRVEEDSPSQTDKHTERATTISDEMRERIERNKQLALERQRQRKLEREKLQESATTETNNTVPSDNKTEEVPVDSLVQKPEDTMEQTPYNNNTMATDRTVHSDTELTKTQNAEENQALGLLNEDEMLEQMWGSA